MSTAITVEFNPITYPKRIHRTHIEWMYVDSDRSNPRRPIPRAYVNLDQNKSISIIDIFDIVNRLYPKTSPLNSGSFYCTNVPITI